MGTISDLTPFQLIQTDWKRNFIHDQSLEQFERFSFNIRDVHLSVKEKSKIVLWGLLCIKPAFSFTFWWRLQKSNSFIVRSIAAVMRRRLSRKYGIHIPKSVEIGPGIYLGHGVGIFINGGVKIGSHCNFSQLTTIGSNSSEAAVIGDNVYIGPGVCVVGGVKIGNNVKIGAGTVVINDIPDNATSVGNPNRIIRHA